MKLQEKYAYLDPFIQASFKIMKAVTGIEIEDTSVKVLRGKESTGGMGIILTLYGDLNGKVVYELSRNMTMNLAMRMIEMSNIVVSSSEEMKKLLESAIIELGNLISGKAITLLSDLGYNCRITPPKGYVGKGTELFNNDRLVFVIELSTQLGLFIINISIEQGN